MQLYIMLVNILTRKVYTVFYLVEVFWFSPQYRLVCIVCRQFFYPQFTSKSAHYPRSNTVPSYFFHNTHLSQLSENYDLGKNVLLTADVWWQRHWATVKYQFWPCNILIYVYGSISMVLYIYDLYIYDLSTLVYKILPILVKLYDSMVLGFVSPHLPLSSQ